jgi:transposase
MVRRRKRQYTAEFRDEVVKLVLSGDKSIGRVARELAIPKGTLDNWLAKAKEARGELPDLVGTSTLSKTEREELLHLRRENDRLRQERDILKKAAAFFAKENL